MKIIITERQLRKLINETQGGEPSIEVVELKLTGEEKEIYYPIEDAVQYIRRFNTNIGKEMYCDVETKKKIELIMNTFSYMEDDIKFNYQIPWTKENKSMKGKWKFDYDKNAVRNDPKQDMINGLRYKFLFIKSTIDRCCDGDKFICDNNFNVIVPPKIETEEDRINKEIRKYNDELARELESNMYHWLSK